MGGSGRAKCLAGPLGIGATCLLWMVCLDVFAQTPQFGLPDAKGMGRVGMPEPLQVLERRHGDYLGEKHLFLVDEEDGTITIKLIKKERAPGGPFLSYDPKTGRDDSLVRFQAEEELLRLRAEVIAPAPPNYVKNPGQRYRITIEGLALSPDFTKIFEVDALDALDVIYTEIVPVMADTYGLQRDAVFYGLMVGMQWLNQSGKLPARIPLTVLRSKAGQTRIVGPGLDTPGIEHEERFTGVQEGQDLAVGTPRTFGPGQAGPMQTNAPMANRGRPGAVERGASIRPRSYGGASVAQGGASPGDRIGNKYRMSRDDLTPADPRRQRMTGIREPRSRDEKMGAAGRRLTVPEYDYPAISASQIENLELMSGQTDSPITGRARGR